MRFVSLEGDLQDPVSQAVPIQTGNRHGSLVIVGHGDKAKAFAFVGAEVADHLDVGHGAKRPEHLPQDALVCVRCQVVHEDAPTCASVPWEVDACKARHALYSHGGEPTVKQSRRHGQGSSENRTLNTISSQSLH